MITVTKKRLVRVHTVTVTTTGDNPIGDRIVTLVEKYRVKSH